MNSELRLWLERDEYGTAELFAAVTSAGFSGISSAWFNVSSLLEFSTSLLTYPLPQGGLPVLEGGNWSKDHPAKLDQTHLFIHFYPIGFSGRIGCLVRLSTSITESCRAESQQSVQTEIETTYESLRNFANSISSMLLDCAKEAVLHGC